MWGGEGEPWTTGGKRKEADNEISGLPEMMTAPTVARRRQRVCATMLPPCGARGGATRNGRRAATRAGRRSFHCPLTSGASTLRTILRLSAERGEYTIIG